MIVIVMLKAFLTIALLSPALAGYGQWKIFHYAPNTANELSLLPNVKQLTPGYTFFGVSDDFNENVITRGYQPFLTDSIWTVPLNTQKSANLRHLYFNLYSTNVKGLKLHVCENNGKCYEQTFKFLKDGYQLPFEWALDDASKVTTTRHPKTAKANSTPTLRATIVFKDQEKPYQLVIAEAKTYEKSFIKQSSQGFFFYELTGKEENKVQHLSRKNFGNIYPLQQITAFHTNTGSTFNFEHQKADRSANERETLNLLRYFFEKYGFYKEHDLDRGAILASIDQIIADSLGFSDKIKRLKQVATQLHDGHFYFREPDMKSRISSPLILKRINTQVQVVGIRDDRLTGKISLGDQVYAIDDKTCERFVDSLSTSYFGNLTERRELAISHLLEKVIDSSSHALTLAKADGSRYRVDLKYDRNFGIPKRFVPEHFGYRKIDPGWAYLKINKWDKGDWIKFYNLKDSIKNSKGIIFDLRGNPGGYEIEVLKIASCFLRQPFEYATETYTLFNQTYTGKTIVKPSSFLDLSKLKVILLVDNKTACGSESFALIFKQIVGATIIGTSTTGSSFSTLYNFHFPEGISLNANVLSKKYLLAEKQTLEYRGIAPDITVKIDRYTDLYGYEDKVLQVARDQITQSMSK